MERSRGPLNSIALAPIILMLCVQSAAAQDQLWVRQFGTWGGDTIRALAPDGAGGVVVGGYTDGNLGSGTHFFDAFVARYDNVGNRLWLSQFNAAYFEFITAVVPIGPAGGAVVAGWTAGSLGGPNAGGDDVFLARYDGEGNQLWIRQFGTYTRDQAWALAPDGAGGVMIAGYTIGSLAAPNTVGSYDAFLARYDAEGNQLWIRQFGTNGQDGATSLASDGAGGVMVAGYTGGDLGGPNAGTTGNEDVFVARYDSEGNQLWIRQFGTSRRDIARALAPDGAGGVMVAGDTGGSLGGLREGNEDGFLARYDSAGNLLWIRQFGTSARDVALALAPDGAGGVFVAGDTGGTLGGSNLGGRDGFLGHYDGDGNLLWFRQFGTDDQENTFALATDGAGGVMLAGRTLGSLVGPNAGSSDAFIIRFGDFGCYHADCDQSTGVGVLDMLDFLCFQSAFMNGEEFACDCDTTTGALVCDIFDFLCFQNAFVAGCP